MISKLTSTYQYIYFRLILFQRKQWNGNKYLATFSANSAITYSAVALIYSAELLYRKFNGTDHEILGTTGILISTVGVFILHSFIFLKDDKYLEDKYLPQKESDAFWKAKGILSLLFVFAPIILLLILM